MSDKFHFRTSASDPLWIDFVPAGNAGGRVGMTLCPGKQAESLLGKPWRRDLAADVKAIADWGACMVVTLTEADEMVALGIDHIGTEVAAAGMAWLHLPVTDQCAPDGRFDAAWATDGAALLEHVRAGRSVVVHCRGGLGRAGTVAAYILMAFGQSPDQAIRAVRSARRGAIETPDQVAWLQSRPAPASSQPMRAHVPPPELKSREFWVKVVAMLQQNWAVIEGPSSSAARTVYFLDDFGGVFDRLEFKSEKEAKEALLRNDFVRYPDSEEMAQFLTPPTLGAYRERAHPNGPIYSSGRFWR